MNETLKELQENEIQMKALEAQANQHEQAARDCRNKRMELKLRNSELRAIVNDAVIVAHTQGAAAAAENARAAAEAHKLEASALLERLKSREESLAAKEKAIDDKLAQLNPTPDV